LDVPLAAFDAAARLTKKALLAGGVGHLRLLSRAVTSDREILHPATVCPASRLAAADAVARS
jgi:hypothetical protein